ncbi:MAG: serine/threonine-protein kinase [Cyanobacteria bacterium J06614_10]
MQSAIPVGTLLQSHYKIVQLLGQGGFGRTYLAEDQGRFNERCAIKEFVPVKGEDRFSDKATQLFQREASVLYQIAHPQIPKFRATFEEEERLFLVQDYVEGPTYHDVLNQRRNQGSSFSEAEVRLFLRQMLPVLAHIHAKGIIHRDISPDNIILRQADGLPVLIDFGVVKEVVTRMQLSGTVAQATTVGKAGYAPSEQMQTGRAYPSSDLYALSVTAIVLLTGKEPQGLFDDVNFAWRWEDSATVSPGLASVLNKALSYRPGDRYQSVSQMAQALQAAGGEPPNIPAKPPTPPPSQLKTVAVGRPNPNANPNTGVSNPTVRREATVRQPGERLPANAASAANNRYGDDTRLKMPSEQDRGSFLENPLAVGGLAVGLAAVAGFGGWAVVQSLDPPNVPEPTITSLPPLSSTPTPTPTPTQVEPQPVEYDQPQLRLTPDVTKTVEGNMRGGDKVNYPLTAEAGQTLTVSVADEGVLLTVFGPDGEPVGRNAERVARWEGELEEDGEYRVQLSPVRGVSSSDYQLDVTLSALPVPDPTEPEVPVEPEDPEFSLPEDPSDEDRLPVEETPDDIPDELPGDIPVQPDVQTQRVSFPSGSDGVLVANNVGPGQVKRYAVNAQEGQILSISLLEAQGPVVFDVLMPGGEMVADAEGLQLWEGFLPVGGDYKIDVRANQFSEFTLEIRASSLVPTE